MTGFKTVAAMVKAMVEELGITVPVALHLDHGTYEGCYKCVKAGFSSIMFDGSHYPFEENLAKSTELVHVADQLGLSIECEVAFIGGTAAGVIFGKLMCIVDGGKTNPLIGSAGVSAVPMAARVSQVVGQKANPSNFLLMHAMGPNVAGVIGTAVAAGTMLAMIGPVGK